MWVASESEEVGYDCGVQAGVPIPAAAVPKLRHRSACDQPLEVGKGSQKH
jgi:hypothetical protein